jgi:predicted Zn-dependent protease
MKRITVLAMTVVFAVFINSCEEGKINLFTVGQDVEFGNQVTEEILANPQEYPILKRSDYPEAYAYLERMRDELLASGEIKYAEEFEWEIYIIDQDVLNAFAVPGGNTFYYTGLIKFLDNEASLAGVMAHEFAHADRRHSTNRMTKMYGVQALLSVIAGEETTVVEELLLQLGGTVTQLKFSRDDEYEADEYAVRFLYETDWDSRGVAYFFEKMEPEEGVNDLMVYFKTHPNPDDRIQEIYEHHKNLGGKDGAVFIDRYEDLKQSLP